MICFCLIPFEKTSRQLLVTSLFLCLIDSLAQGLVCGFPTVSSCACDTKLAWYVYIYGNFKLNNRYPRYPSFSRVVFNRGFLGVIYLLQFYTVALGVSQPRRPASGLGVGVGAGVRRRRKELRYKFSRSVTFWPNFFIFVHIFDDFVQFLTKFSNPPPP